MRIGNLSALLAIASTRVAIAQVGDSDLSVTITLTNQSFILGWFGSNGMTYQVESSSTLTSWTSDSVVRTGSNTRLLVTNPIAA